MLDNIIVLVYLLLLPAVGIYYRTRKNSFRAYSHIDKAANNKLLLVATIFASSVGGGTTFGLAEKVFAEDLAYVYGLLLTIPVDIIIAVYIVPRIIQHYDTTTVGDIMAKYYGNSGRIITGLTVITVSVGLIAAQINVSGRIFEYILKIDHLKGIILSYLIVVIYTTIGGLSSVIFTNVVQFFAMLIAIPLVTIFGFWEIDWHDFSTNIPEYKVFFSSDNNLLSNTIAATLSFCLMGMPPSFIQRALINKNPNITKKAIYIKSVIYAVFLLFIACNGLLAYYFYADVPSYLSLPILIDNPIPIGFKGVVVIGMLAAVMSTADSDLNVAAISLVKDLFVPIFKITSEKKLLIIARFFNIIVGISAIIIALSFASVVDLVIFIVGFWSPIILIPLVFCLFGITIPKFAMIFCSISGALSFLWWEYFLPEKSAEELYELVTIIPFKGMFIGSAVNLLLFTMILCFNHIFIVRRNSRSKSVISGFQKICKSCSRG